MVCIFQGRGGKQFEICYIIPGREIPKWFENVNICDASVFPCYYCYYMGPGRPYKIQKVKIQLPGSGSGFDGCRGIVLCLVFLPTERHLDPQGLHIGVDGLVSLHPFLSAVSHPEFNSKYGKVESHHLWMHSLSKHNFRFPKTPGCSIDKKGFHEVEFEIVTSGLEVEKIGFRVI